MNYYKRIALLWEHLRFRILVAFFILLTVFIGFIIVPVEIKSESRNINTISDGIWWAFTTVTSVGYGDTYPVTPMGRTLGMILMILGTTLTGIILGFVTVTLFHSRDEYYWRRIAQRLDRMEDKIDKIERQQNYVVRSVHESTDDQT